ncbi:hypothetical protein ACNCU7_004894, partial [Escherichia coli]
HNQHNIWSSVFLERILDPVCMSFLDRVKKERVYAKMVTALNVYNDGGNDSNLLIVFYVQIMPDDFVMQLHQF